MQLNRLLLSYHHDEMADIEERAAGTTGELERNGLLGTVCGVITQQHLISGLFASRAHPQLILLLVARIQ